MPSSAEAQRRRRRAFLLITAQTLEALKLARGCIDCGYREHAAALQFDHRDPATKRKDLGWVEDRSRLVNATKLQRFLDHVQAYCDVRCANCHVVRTTRERHWLINHATRPADLDETLF